MYSYKLSNDGTTLYCYRSNIQDHIDEKLKRDYTIDGFKISLMICCDFVIDMKNKKLLKNRMGDIGEKQYEMVRMYLIMTCPNIPLDNPIHME